ncbi:4Fe-4S dicluster domain-containing protein [Paraburkholderia sp. MM5482-R1]|uniref:4Fe-4S dicluster domain-containing protein n=1 Tax=unclassified Paraburkholderia TaxID=2615204 RepID=UPI003D1B4C38
MTYIVGSGCDRCKYTTCVDVCPVDAFRETPTSLVIDPESCIDCGVCEPECPVEVIFSARDVPVGEAGAIELNRTMAAVSPSITQSRRERARRPVRPATPSFH